MTPLQVVFAALTLLFSGNIAAATTYTIQNPLGSLGNVWFPELTSSSIVSGGVGGVSGVVITDGTLGTLSALNIVDFQIGVTALDSSNGWSSDVSAPPRSGTGFLEVSGSAFFATPTGLFFDFGSATSSYVKFERDSTSLGQADTFFCLNAGGANCGGASIYDVTAAVLFASNPEWSVFIGRPKSDLLNNSNYASILSDTGIFQLAQLSVVSEVPVPQALPLLAAGLGAMGFMGWRKKRKAVA